MADKFRTGFLTGGGGDRRDFFRSTVGRVAQEVGKRAEARVVQHRYLRPPGALDEVAFLAACTRCGDCMPVCPVNAIVKVASSGGLAAGTPHIDPVVQGCIACPDMPCVNACPTEALSLPVKGWDGLHMGFLQLDSDRCIAFQDRECGVCAQACPIGEKALSLDEGKRPVLKIEGCVGCGACIRVCVTSPSSLSLRY